MPLRWSRKEIIESLETYLKSKNLSLGDSATRENFIYTFNSIETKPPYEPNVLAQLSYPKFKETLQRLALETKDGRELQDIKWNFFFNSTLSYLQILANGSPYLAELHDKTINKYLVRDSLMAVNLAFLSDKVYPDKKIIVWAASSHITKNYFNPLILANSMGTYLQKNWSGKTYTIGFTAAYGSIRNIGTGKDMNLQAIKPESFEDLMLQTGKQNFFLDLKANNKLKKGKWLSEDRVMRPFGYVDVTKDWTQCFDAVIFNKEMTPSHQSR